MNPLATALGLVLLVVLVLVLFRAFVTVVTVHDYERGLRYANGRFRGLVGEGTHLAMPPFREIRLLDARPVHLVLEGQEVLTADAVPLRVSLVARYVVGDPVAAVTGDQDFRRAIYLTFQLALRDAIAARAVDDLLRERASVGAAVLERIGPGLARLGVEVLAVDVRDLMLTAELKRTFAAVAAARKEGEAALERARGETASLRNLANAARMLEDHPGLVQLRALQALASSSGNTLMLGVADGAVRPGQPAHPRRPEPDTAPER